MSPAPLRIAALQTDLHWENPVANHQHQAALLAQHLLGPVDLIALPEMCSTGFSMNAAQWAEPESGPTTAWMQHLAQQYDALVVGSVMTRDAAGQFRNRMMAVSAHGIEAFADKAHLFRMGGEHQTYTPGKHRVTCSWRGWRIRLGVCYDLRFPLWARNHWPAQPLDAECPTVYGPDSYDLYLNVANWPAARSAHWRTLLAARAIENLAYAVGVNRVGTDALGTPHTGHSLILDYQGEVVASLADNQEGVLHSALEFEALTTWRTRFPAWRDADSFDVQTA
jgi:predicted amidohydrolase